MDWLNVEFPQLGSFFGVVFCCFLQIFLFWVLSLSPGFRVDSGKRKKTGEKSSFKSCRLISISFREMHWSGWDLGWAWTLGNSERFRFYVE